MSQMFTKWHINRNPQVEQTIESPVIASSNVSAMDTVKHMV